MAGELIKQFHTIDGISIGERKRNLNKYLQNLIVRPEEKQALLDNLKPKTYLENLYYVDVLIQLREAHILLEIIRKDNEASVNKILRQRWFLQSIFGKVEPKEFVNDFLPTFSFTVRLKLLKKLYHCYPENIIDQIFDLIVERYGFSIAATFIFTCTSRKITEVLKSNEVKLSTHDLKELYKKDPNLINTYLEEQKRYNKEGCLFDNNFLIYLAQRDPTYFWELSEKFITNSDLKFGRRTTKKLIPIKKQQIINNPKKYIKCFRQETLVRTFNQQNCFKEFYHNLFPRNIQKLEDNSNFSISLLKYYPKYDQYKLFSTTFTEVIKEDIFSYTSCVRDNLLELISDVDLRKKWAQIKYKESNDDEYIKLYALSESVALIKQKVNVTFDIKNRSKLLNLLIKTCAINDDLKALEEVLKYFCERHRNDDKLIRSSFLQTLESCFKLAQFNNIHWKYIHEILTVQSLKNERSGFDCYKLRIKYIEYLFSNSGLEDDKNYFILEYIKDEMISFNLKFATFDEIKDAAIKKTILLLAIENIDSLIKTQNREFQSSFLKSQLLAQIFKFNLMYPGNEIHLEENENVKEILNTVTKEDVYVSYSFQNYFSAILCKLNRSKFEEQLLTFYLGNIPMRQMSSDKAVKWCLKYDPLVIVNHFKIVMNSVPQYPRRYYLWSKIKYYSHLSLDKKVVEYCLRQLHTEKPDEKLRLILPLSVLHTPQQYIKLMSDLDLMPTSSKFVIEDTESKKKMYVQKEFLKHFKNFEDPIDYMPVLLEHFFQGDYLQDSLALVYSAFHRIAENKLAVYVEYLNNNNAISVKKHALFLAQRVCSQQKVLEISCNFEHTKNESLQKNLCLSSLKYFSKNPTQNLFEKICVYMNFLKETDRESLQKLIDVHIPASYESCYIMSVWNLLENLKTTTKAIGTESLLSSLLNSIDAINVKNLPQNFCKSIINSYFLTIVENEADQVCEIYLFTIKFLMYSRNQKDNFNFVFSLLAKYKKESWMKGKNTNLCHFFFNKFYQVTCKADLPDADLAFIIMFSENWQNVFTPIDCIKEYVLLNIIQLKKEIKDDMETYSRHITSFANHINSQFGEFVFSKFINVIAKYDMFLNKDKTLVQILTYILKYNLSPINCIFAIEVMSIKNNQFYKNKLNPMYKEIDLMLREMTDPKVQLCYNLHLKSDTSL